MRLLSTVGRSVGQLLDRVILVCGMARLILPALLFFQRESLGEVNQANGCYILGRLADRETRGEIQLTNFFFHFFSFTSSLSLSPSFFSSLCTLYFSSSLRNKRFS